MNSVIEKFTTQVTELSQLGMKFEVGVMAGRLAALLRHRFAGDESPVAASLKFLDYHYADVAEGRKLADCLSLLAERRQLVTEQPFARLSRVLVLTGLEQDLLVLAGLAEHHEGYADIFRSLHPASLPYPTLGLAAQLLSSDKQRHDVNEVITRGALVSQQLLSLQGDAPLYARHLVLLEALWLVLLGADAWPQAVKPAAVTAVLAGLDDWLAQADVARARQVLASGAISTLVMTAESESAAWQRGVALAEAAGVVAVSISWPLKPNSEFEVQLRAHLISRGAVPVLRLQTPAQEASSLAHCPLFDFPGPVVVCSHVGLATSVRERPMLNLVIDPLKAPALRDMWRAVLPSLADQASRLAARYPLEPGQALQVAQDLSLGRDNQAPTLDDVAESLRARAAMSLGGGVQLVRPVVGWSQLVLPDVHSHQLQEAVNRLDLQAQVLDDWQFLAGRRGARGVRMLFAGPPGTGKTLSAEVLANALNVDLLLVDLSQVVSKWIGETEKNLAEVFATAERAKAVLFFDEAESLFGKRTEVNDSHDRYANLETAYLLSRLERFDGLAILATNLRQNIDSAFSRRLEYIIEYEEPGLEQRVALWKCHIPVGVPLAADVNLKALAANYPVVGGLIKNAAVAAAFMAAGDGQVITQEHFTRAIRREYEKAGKAFRELRTRNAQLGH